MLGRAVLWTLFLFGCLSYSSESLGIDLEDTSSNDIEDVGEERLFAFPIILAAGNGGLGGLGGLGGGSLNLNNSLGMAALAALGGILGLLPLLGLGGLLAGLLLNYDDGRIHDRYPDTAYRSFRNSEPSLFDWERLSLIDWMSIGEETFRKFDPSDLDCQKRFICEIHQNARKFGYVAEKIVNFVSYFQYLKALGLPEQLARLIDEYQEAAERGGTLKKDCGDVYSSCQFSVKKIMERVSSNEI